MDSSTSGSTPYAVVCVQDPPQTTPSRFLKTASECGYQGLIILVTDPHQAPRTDFPVHPPIDSAWGLSIEDPDRGTVSRLLTEHRKTTPVLRATGGDIGMCRFLANQERIDVLGDPGPGGEELPHTVLKTAKEHGVYVEFDFGQLLQQSGSNRAASIKTLRNRYRIVEHYNIPYVITTHADSHLQLRSPRSLCAVGDHIDIPAEAVMRGLSSWKDILHRTRCAHDDRYIQPGIKVESNETADREPR